MGAFKCPTCIHKEVCKDELLNRPIGEKCAHYLAVEKFTSTNTQSTAIAQICDDMAASVGSVPAGRDVTNRRIGEWERRLRAL